jgi:hypothetical protein
LVTNHWPNRAQSLRRLGLFYSSQTRPSLSQAPDQRAFARLNRRGQFQWARRWGWPIFANSMETPRNNRLSPAGWITLLILLGFLAASLWYAVKAWSAMAGVSMSAYGWTFLGLGVVVTVALGAGLMALVFYSSRHNYDR